MDLRIKTPGKRVIAYYERAEKIGGITLGIYGDDMAVYDVATLGYDKQKKKMVLLVHDLNDADVDVKWGETSE